MISRMRVVYTLQMRLSARTVRWLHDTNPAVGYSMQAHDEQADALDDALYAYAQRDVDAFEALNPDNPLRDFT